jgi:hypothetical protein
MFQKNILTCWEKTPTREGLVNDNDWSEWLVGWRNQKRKVVALPPDENRHGDMVSANEGKKDLNRDETLPGSRFFSWIQ